MSFAPISLPLISPVSSPIAFPPFTPPPIAPVVGPDCSKELESTFLCGNQNGCSPDGEDCDACFAEGVALAFCFVGFEECTDTFVDYYKCAESAGCELPEEESDDLGIESCPACQTPGLLAFSCFSGGGVGLNCAEQSEALEACTTQNDCLTDFDDLDPSACTDCLREIADISACFSGFDECADEYTELLECTAENDCSQIDDGPPCAECLAPAVSFYLCLADDGILTECDASPLSLYNCYKENEATCATCLPPLELLLTSEEDPSCQVATAELGSCGGCAPCSAEEGVAIECVCNSAPISSPAIAPVDFDVSEECLVSGFALITCYTINPGDCSACQAEFGLFLAEERLPTCQEAQGALAACGGGCSKCTSEEEDAVPCVCGDLDKESAQPAIPEPLAPAPVTSDPVSQPVTPEPTVETSAPVTMEPLETTAPAPTSATSVQTLSFGLMVLAVAVTTFL